MYKIGDKVEFKFSVVPGKREVLTGTIQEIDRESHFPYLVLANERLFISLSDKDIIKNRTNMEVQTELLDHMMSLNLDLRLRDGEFELINPGCGCCSSLRFKAKTLRELLELVEDD